MCGPRTLDGVRIAVMVTRPRRTRAIQNRVPSEILYVSDQQSLNESLPP